MNSPPSEEQGYIVSSPRKVNAVYSFTGANPHELQFDEGDIIQVLNTFNNESGWWYGRKDNKYGIFPSNYTSPYSEPRRMKKTNKSASMFIKRMQSELGFVKKDGEASPSTEMNEVPDNAEVDKVLDAYQRMIAEMKAEIDLLIKQCEDYEIQKYKSDDMIRVLTTQLDEALKKEEEVYEMMREQQRSQDGVEEENVKAITRLQRENEMLLDKVSMKESMKDTATGKDDKYAKPSSAKKSLGIQPAFVYVFFGLVVGFFASHLLYRC